MYLKTDEEIIENFYTFIKSDSTPCIGAKGALARNNIQVMVADHFDTSEDDQQILNFAYSFIRHYRTTTNGLHSLVIIFKDPQNIDEDTFEKILWRRLRALRNMDATQYPYDARVSSDPSSPSFSFSLMEEAFFIIALHSQSPRLARRFSYPALVFNPHAQFEEMKRKGTFDKIKKINRNRDIQLSGSINPMIRDFGEASEIFQYSGKQYSADSKCPFH